MISLGAVACVEDLSTTDGYRILGEYQVNLEELPGDTRDPETMKNFWAKHPEAWEISTRDPKPVDVAMLEFRKWLQPLKQHGKLVFAAYPSGFDFTFVYWYFHTFADYCDFGFAPIDMKSYAHAILGKNFRNIVKRNMPKEWFRKFEGKRHCAVDDARAQAHMFFQAKLSAASMRESANETAHVDSRRNKP